MHADFRFLFLCFISSLLATPCYTQDNFYSGQLSFWLSANQQTEKSAQLGLRYIPAFSFSTPLSNTYSFDTDASIKTYAINSFHSKSKAHTEQDISAYRLWTRFSASNYELRLGLQKINFGPASIFRPLMWFDTIDPRDPLQITSGVYGLLGRYYFLNNANIWLWGLLGNDDLKGWEFYPTAKWKPEFGGRVQYPVFNGEAAFSFHHRQLDLGSLAVMFPFANDTIVSENRFAFDGKWDMGVGIWIEAVLTHHDSELLFYEWEQAFNIGLDYTFDIGNGFNVLTEYFILESTNKLLQSGEGIKLSALSMNYPIGLLDTFSGIIYYDWETKDLYRFLSVQRNYDNWSFYVFTFWNPDQVKLAITSGKSNQFAGKGLQLMVVFNH